MRSAPLKIRGMTLLELMVSLAVGLMILLLAAAMLRRSGDDYDHLNGSIGSDREAREWIHQLSTDLSSAIYHKESVLEAGSGLGFLSLQPASAQASAKRIGDLCAIHYYLKDLTIGDRTVRCLMRGFRESGETFDALREDRVASLFSERADQDEPVAFGVISFEAHPRSRDAIGTWADWQNHSNLCPEVLDVKLTLARRNLVRKLHQPSDWDKRLERKRAENCTSDIDVYETPMHFGNHANP